MPLAVIEVEHIFSSNNDHMVATWANGLLTPGEVAAQNTGVVVCNQASKNSKSIDCYH